MFGRMLVAELLMLFVTKVALPCCTTLLIDKRLCGWGRGGRGWMVASLPWVDGTGCRTTSLFSILLSSSSSLFLVTTTTFFSSSTSSLLLTPGDIITLLCSSSSSSLGLFLTCSCSRGWPDSGTK